MKKTIQVTGMIFMFFLISLLTFIALLIAFFKPSTYKKLMKAIKIPTEAPAQELSAAA